MELNRRMLLGGAAATAGTLFMPQIAQANAAANAYFNGYQEDAGFQYRRTNLNRIDPVWRRQMVKYFSPEPPGTVVVDTSNHFLYWVWENNTALRYGVGVGREGFKWYGRARIDRKALWPRWVPPPEMLKRQPDLPRLVEGGAPNNPLGPRALYLYRDGGDLGYRLHGTLEPWSIGHDVSSGCVRMLPEDVIDLYQRCPKGTAVLVLEHLGAGAG
ncbi:L,D-transpeptidase [Roseibium marinum]|uniref:Lipoprotein-anchoring transpeptidase ErfK/SrfK n=1 Tax=Roseibium marinum TaxID=281252 RepID=A0A2S3UTE2_9HYPH|nr:L,D-transpeptidase [Roseibium marinum]POF30985.1 lipoprotein-anchoring transpeptidase ErfK/SrfK [Roseibium marinum]